MNDAATLHRRLAEANEPSPFNTKSEGFEAQEFVGQDLVPMSDEEREQAAYRAGVAMQSWYSQFKLTGNPADLDRAYHCMGMQKRLLAGRSAAFVAKLEKERGLA